MSDNFKKQRVCVSLSPDALKKIDAIQAASGDCLSRGEIIETAVDCYKAQNDLKNNVDYVAPILKTIVEGTTQVEFDRLNRNQFKVAVELGILSRVLSKAYEVDTQTYQRLRKDVVDEVKHTKGILSFGDT